MANTSTSEVVNFQIDYTITCTVFVVTIVIMLTGTVGNILVIGSVMTHKKLRVLSNTFIINLAVSDMMVSLGVNLSGLLALKSEGSFLKSRTGLCEFFGSLCIVACFSSIMNIAAIAINRYIKICHYKDYNKFYNKRTVPIMVIVFWIFCFFLDFPNFFEWGSHDFSPKLMLCTYDHRQGMYSYTLYFFILGFMLPWSLSGVAYLKILLFTRKSNRNLRESMTNSRNKGIKDVGINEFRLIRSTVTIWALFLIMWTPYAFILLFDTGYEWDIGVYLFSIITAHFNSSVNSILYAITNQYFRESYWRLLTCRRWLKVKVGNINTASTAAGTEVIM